MSEVKLDGASIFKKLQKI